MNTRSVLKTALIVASAFVLPQVYRDVTHISVRYIVSKRLCITCKRGSAKHSVKDDHALIPMGTCDFLVAYVPAQPKPLNRSR